MKSMKHVREVFGIKVVIINDTIVAIDKDYLKNLERENERSKNKK